MTDPAPEPTLSEQIRAATQEVLNAKLARPRDPARVADAVAELERLKALRDG